MLCALLSSTPIMLIFLYGTSRRFESNVKLVFFFLVFFYRQIDRDCEFLEQERIMDYSLLVGLHFRNTTAAGNLIPSGAKTPTGHSLYSILLYDFVNF